VALAEAVTLQAQQDEAVMPHMVAAEVAEVVVTMPQERLVTVAMVAMP
jgi:hypothetical protein